MTEGLAKINSDLPRLLRVIATGSQAKENRHDIIFNTAADTIERLQVDNKRLTKALDEICGTESWYQAMRIARRATGLEKE